MGEAFYEPIDDMGPERTPRAPEVLEPLADQWRRGGYDVRWLYRTILHTQAYQRRVRSTATAAGKTAFASGCPSRLRADQVFEALAQALGLPRDAEGNVVLTVPNNRKPRPAASQGGPGEEGRGQEGRGSGRAAAPRQESRPRSPQGRPASGLRTALRGRSLDRQR